MTIAVFFAFYLYHNRKKGSNLTHIHDPLTHTETILEHQSAESLADPTMGMAMGYCHNHSHEKAQAACAICNIFLCEECVSEYETLNFCPDHFNLFLQNDWEVVETVKTTPDKTQKSFYLYDFKNTQWNLENIPTFIMTEYKIDVNSDQIESHISLYAKKEEVKNLQNIIKKGLH